jgi:hypothetical protein
MDSRWIDVWFMDMGKVFYLLQTSSQPLWSTQTSRSMGTGDLSREVELSSREASVPSSTFTALCLIKYKNFPLLHFIRTSARDLTEHNQLHAGPSGRAV